MNSTGMLYHTTLVVINGSTVCDRSVEKFVLKKRQVYAVPLGPHQALYFKAKQNTSIGRTWYIGKCIY